MFYTVFDLNGMLEVGTFFPNYKIERGRMSFNSQIFLILLASKCIYCRTAQVKWSYGLKTLAIVHTMTECSVAKIFICFYLIYFLTTRYLPVNPWHFWYYLKANGIDLYKLFTTTAKPFLWKLGCRSKDCFDLYLAYLFNLASDSEKCTSFSVICRAPFIRLFLLLALDLSTFCI